MKKFKPYKHQRTGALTIEKFNGRALVADEMGTGKSGTTLLWIRRNPEIRPVVVICPASLKFHWEREARQHINMYAEIMSGRNPPDIGLIKTPPMIIINYDILKNWVGYLRKIKPKLVVLDEVHYVANRRAQRSKYVRTICRRVKHVIALSGSPFTNRAYELWNVLNLVRPDVFNSFPDYAKKYCPPKWTQWGWDYSRTKNLGKLNKVLKRKIMIRRLKSDVLKDLPPKRNIVLPLEISDRKQYDKASKDLLGWLKQYSLKSKAWRSAKATALTRIGHLKRLAATLKMPYVMQWIDDFLKETDEKLIVFGIHRKIIDMLNDRYGNLSVFVNGKVSINHRRIAVDRFQKDKNTRLFFGNIKAAGVGLNLTAASTVACIEFPWTPGDLAQCMDRAHRIGQKKVVTCYHLVAHGTVEEKILDLLQKKHKDFAEVMDGVKGVKGSDLNLRDMLLQEMMKRKVA